MIRIILFLIVVVSYLSADLPPIKTYKTINECQSDIYYGNGIGTSIGQATVAKDKLMDYFEIWLT